ncbi:MAG: LytR family transcriptional regulator [Acidimicrobiia bacterium]|nr:LytR family transcriptional regulator [Acidimicrobiia bacterium]
MTTEPSGDNSSIPPDSLPRRRWWKLVVVLISGSALLVGGVVFYNLWDARSAIEDIPTTSIVALEDDNPPAAVTTSTSVLGATTLVTETTAVRLAPEVTEPVTFLVIGGDTRQGLPEELGINDRLEGNRADVVMLATLDNGSARLLSLPRDLRVRLDGYGDEKLNAAFAIGGADMLIETVEEITGVQVDHYLEMDFYGYAGIVDALGGVNIAFAYPARDLKSGLSVDAGVRLLDGKEALAYARSRSYQELRDGQWVSVDAHDLGRIRRQQSLVLAMLESAKRWTMLFDLGDVIRAAGDHLVIDAGLTANRLVELAWAARSLNRENIEIFSLPLDENIVEGVYYLDMIQPEAEEMLAVFRGEETGTMGEPLNLTEGYRLQILNGNGGNQQASLWADWLEGQAPVSGPISVGDAGVYDFVDTVVRVRPQDHEIGQQMVDILGFGMVEAGSVDERFDAVVILGADALNSDVLLGVRTSR